MDHARGIALWIIPALLASALCSIGWHLWAGGKLNDLQIVYGIAAVSLIFTAGGSALLVLAFAFMRPAPVWSRYVALLALGAVAGGLMLWWGSFEGLKLGTTYGLVTAAFWVVAHKMLYGRRAR